jgi:hypothetical protein
MLLNFLSFFGFPFGLCLSSPTHSRKSDAKFPGIFGMTKFFARLANAAARQTAGYRDAEKMPKSECRRMTYGENSCQRSWENAGCTNVNTGTAGTAEHSPGQFNTTRWSVVLSCADSEIESVAARDALSELCKTYWRPLFAYVCRRGYSTHDAEDLTQEFFSGLLQGPLLERADPERGRFRSLLLKALQDFLGHANEKLRAHKRGGGMKFVSWDDWMAEAPSQ